MVSPSGALVAKLERYPDPLRANTLEFPPDEISMIRDVVREVVSQLPGYEHRPQQLEMAELIDTALRERRHAIIEAGTGSGKSFGYLIPILESGKKAVISTGTIALQEQLLHKDVPF